MAQRTGLVVRCAVALAGWFGLASGAALADDVTQLRPLDTSVGDRFGQALATDGTTVVAGAPFHDQDATDGGSAWVYVACRGFLPLQAELRPTDHQVLGNFGSSVAVSGDTIAVGAPGMSGGGAIYVFERTRGAWTQTAKLAGPAGTSALGNCVAIDGDTIVAGAPLAAGAPPASAPNTGSVFVFERTGGTWTLQTTIVGEDAGGRFGSSVAVRSDRLVAGAPDGASSLGVATTYVRSGETWTREARLVPGDAVTGDKVGASVSLDGARLAIGAPDSGRAGPGGAGAVYTYLLTDGAWVRTATVFAGSPTAGGAFGTSVALDGAGLAIGSPHADTTSADTGAVELFAAGPDGWAPVSVVAAPGAAAGAAVGTSVALARGRLVLSSALAGIAFAQWSDLEQKVTDRDGRAFDEFGGSVAISGDTAIVGAVSTDTTSANTGAAFVFVRTGAVWTEQQRLAAPDAGQGDAFGRSVAISGDTALVGASQDDDRGSNSGAAWVFVRTGTVWTAHAKLTAADGAANDTFGVSVALSDGTAVVGARGDDDRGDRAGAAYVFTRAGSGWAQQTKLTASDGAAVHDFGAAVALDGETVLVGAPGHNAGTGAVYVFVRAAELWTELQRLAAPDAAPDDAFGTSVALSGERALVGVLLDQDLGVTTGSAWVFVRAGSAWTAEQKLIGSDVAAGHAFGVAVALAGDAALVAADGDDERGAAAGAAYLFTRADGTWTEKQKLTDTDGTSSDLFGISVALSGTTAVIGATGDDDHGPISGSASFRRLDLPATDLPVKLIDPVGESLDVFATSVAIEGGTALVGEPRTGTADAGVAQVFVRSSGVWIADQRLRAPANATPDGFGNSVALSCGTAVVGAPAEASGRGAAYVFVREGATWALQARLAADDGADSDRFGWSVAIHGDTILVGAFRDETASPAVGSAYVFVRSGAAWIQQQKLLASDGIPGDYLGRSVALSGDTAVVGAYRDSDLGGLAGAAYVFVRDAGVWSEQQKLRADDGAALGQFGRCVGLSGDTAVIGAFGDNGFTGAAYVFERSGSTWTQQQKLTELETSAGGKYGIAVAVSGDRAVVGADLDAVPTGFRGVAYVYGRSGSTWTRLRKLTAPNLRNNAVFGNALALAGDHVIVGAPGDDRSGANTGAAFMFDTSLRASPWFSQFATVGGSHGGAVFASGGSPPVQWRTIAGSLPPGVTLDAKTGEMSGTPTTAGSFAATIEASDACDERATFDAKFTVGAQPVIDDANLPTAVVDRFYRRTIAVTGGAGPFQWTFDDGGSGFALDSATGALFGTPVEPGRYTLRFGGTDSAGAEAVPVQTTLVVARVEAIATGKAKFGVSAGPVPSYHVLELIEGTQLTVTAKVKKGFLPPALELFNGAGTLLDLGAALRPGATAVKLTKYVIPATSRYTLVIYPRSDDPFAVVSVTLSVTAPRSVKRTVDLPGATTTDFRFAALPGSKVAVTIVAAKGQTVNPEVTSVVDAEGDPIAVAPVTSPKKVKFSIASAPGGNVMAFVHGIGDAVGTVIATAVIRPPKGYVFTMHTSAGGEEEY